MVEPAGVEPATNRLWAGSSTNWAKVPHEVLIYKIQAKSQVISLFAAVYLFFIFSKLKKPSYSTFLILSVHFIIKFALLWKEVDKQINSFNYKK